MRAAARKDTLVRCLVFGRRLVLVGMLSLMIDSLVIIRLRLEYPVVLRFMCTLCSTGFMVIGLAVLYRVRWGYHAMVAMLRCTTHCRILGDFSRTLLADIHETNVKRLFVRRCLLVPQRSRKRRHVDG